MTGSSKIICRLGYRASPAACCIAPQEAGTALLDAAAIARANVSVGLNLVVLCYAQSDVLTHGTLWQER